MLRASLYGLELAKRCGMSQPRGLRNVALRLISLCIGQSSAGRRRSRNEGRRALISAQPPLLRASKLEHPGVKYSLTWLHRL